ncbi:hypothetical protein BGZ83_005053, partial [Gryganskiella cystojenkinii]
TILIENRSDFYLSALNESLKEKLQSWFVGFLDLERLTWQSPAVLLEKITQYEAVHKFRDVQDLKRRVGPGRRVFALMNKSLPTEPLVFVQVALVKTLSNNVQDILNDPFPGHPNPAETVKCAIFYSITTQVGKYCILIVSSYRRLSGIELGNFLIKRVVRSLKVEFPQIETFSTLSPIPGFRRWVNQSQNLGHQLLLPEEESTVVRLGNTRAISATSAEDQFKLLLKDKTLFSDSEAMGDLRPILSRLCGRYILVEKRRHLALDPVANFHLRNGACAHRLNWLGDTSPKGMEESFGLMINYLYSLDHIEMNNQQYLQDGTISVSSQDLGFKRALKSATEIHQGRQGSEDHSTGGRSLHNAAGQIVQTDIQKATTTIILVTTPAATVDIHPSDSRLLTLIFDDVMLAVSNFLVVPLRDLQKDLLRAFLDQPDVFIETLEMRDQVWVLFSELFDEVLFNAGLGLFHEKVLQAKTRAILDTICLRGPANSKAGEDQVDEAKKRLWDKSLEAHREQIDQASKCNTLQEFPWFIRSEIRDRVELTSRELLDRDFIHNLIVNWE